MAILTAEVLGTDWPSIGDGERTDRGWEHFLRLIWPLAVGLNDDMQLRLNVPSGEAWLLEYLAWDWTLAGAPLVIWTSGEMIRVLRHGQVKRYSSPPVGWIESDAVIARTIYPLPGADEETGNVHRSQIETDVGGLPELARWGFNWINTTVASTAELHLWLHVVRVPVARVRAWSLQDMENALTGIDALAKRVT